MGRAGRVGWLLGLVFAEHERLADAVAGPVNSMSRPWWTMRSMIAAASLSSAKTVPHLLNSMFVVKMMLRL